MDDKEKYLSQMLNKERTPEQARACYLMVQQKIEQQKKRGAVIRRRVLACVASLVVICAAVLVPLLLKKDDVRYYDENLDFYVSTQEEMIEEFNNLNIDIPSFDTNATLSYQLCKPTDGDVIVGGDIAFECLTDSNYYDGVVTFYHKSVLIDEDYYAQLTSQFVCDGITYKYALGSYVDDVYTYNAYATTKDFTIIIEYRAVFDEFTTFIDQLY